MQGKPTSALKPANTFERLCIVSHSSAFATASLSGEGLAASMLFSSPFQTYIEQGKVTSLLMAEFFKASEALGFTSICKVFFHIFAHMYEKD